MSQQGARVISLEDARRRRAEQQQKAQATQVIVWYPVWFWVPLWPAV
jgi:hypothetical protein